jgi:hypothetical protein
LPTRAVTAHSFLQAQRAKHEAVIQYRHDRERAKRKYIDWLSSQERQKRQNAQRLDEERTAQAAKLKRQAQKQQPYSTPEASASPSAAQRTDAENAAVATGVAVQAAAKIVNAKRHSSSVRTKSTNRGAGFPAEVSS